MALTNDQVTAKNFKAIVDGMAPFLGAKTQTISESAFEQLSQAEKDNGTAYFVPDATPVTDFTVMGNRFDKANIYTADERMIGSWMGKPLYQKIIDNISFSSSQVLISFSNEYTVREIRGFVYNANGRIPIGYGTDTNDAVSVYQDSTGLQFQNGYYSTYPSGEIIVQYTKTSDATVNIGTGNDYSTDEQIIGTWIDGKKLYQKTISHVFTSTATENLMPCTVENIIDISALIFNGANRLQIPFNADGYFCWVGVDNGILKVFRSAGGAWQGASLLVTVQYTKTTD